MKACKKCGKMNQEDSCFCEYCGDEIKNIGKAKNIKRYSVSTIIFVAVLSICIGFCTGCLVGDYLKNIKTDDDEVEAIEQLEVSISNNSIEREEQGPYWTQKGTGRLVINEVTIAEGVTKVSLSAPYRKGDKNTIRLFVRRSGEEELKQLLEMPPGIGVLDTLIEGPAEVSFSIISDVSWEIELSKVNQ